MIISSSDERIYRKLVKSDDLVIFKLTYRETDLLVSTKFSTKYNLREITKFLILKYYSQIENYIKRNPLFKKSFVPIEVGREAPDIVKSMADAGKIAKVGPMAAVAGAMAEFIGSELLNFSNEVIIENGGDIFIKSTSERVISVYAGRSEFSYKIGLKINPKESPLGVCTSSGTLGHSVSFGKADAVVVVSKSAAIADTFATAIGNIVKTESDVKRAIEFAKTESLIKGLIAIIGDKIGVCGNIEIVLLRVDSNSTRTYRT